jgi:glycosyltransferase involved in cell wall biosynthesis
MHQPTTPERPYTDPWNQPLAQRLHQLHQCETRVAYYYESANNSTFRYRAYNMCQVLNDAPEAGVSAACFFRTDLHAINKLADAAQVLVICRSGWDQDVSRLLACFRARGKPVYFDCDDFVFNTDYTQLLVQSLDLDASDPRVWDDWFGMIGRMGQTLRQCDAGITTNPTLARQMADYSGKPVAVVPNFMNREQLDMSAAVFEEKQRAGFQGDGTLCLGYFSGSPSHKNDFAIAEPALATLLDEMPELRLMMVGYIEPGPALAPFASRIIRQPFHDYVNLQRLISTVDFNLMPLQANAFTDCKSELKYFEAAAVGTLSIASPAPNHLACITHGRNGYLSRAHQWTRTLREAIGRMADYPAMALAAREHALRHYGCMHQRQAILRALQLG